jgi:hypothetical protein
MERPMNSGEKKEHWNIASEAYNGNKEKDAAESRGNEERAINDKDDGREADHGEDRNDYSIVCERNRWT